MGVQKVKVGGNSVVIVVRGDNNTIYNNRSRLELYPPSPRNPSATDSTRADWLDPDYRIHDFIGRDQLIAELDQWLHGSPPLSIRVITGPGGAGKTRLALELCCLASDKKWQAGLVKDVDFRQAVALGEQRHWSWARSTLVVLDYAASLAVEVQKWLLRLLDHPQSGPPLRILLLERHGQPGQGWWQTAFESGGWDEEKISALLNPREPIQLESLAIADRRALFANALSLAGSRESVPPPGGNPAFDRDMERLEWSDPLFLLMAGQWAAMQGVNAVLTLTRPDLALRMAKREGLRIITARVEQEKKDQDQGIMLRHLAALITLRGGMERNLLEDIIPSEKEKMGCTEAGSPNQLASWLQESLGSSENKIAPIKPDLIGEGFIIRYLGDGREPKSTESLLRAGDAELDQVVPRLIHAGMDFAYASEHDFSTSDYKKNEIAALLKRTQAPVLWLDALIERSRPNFDQLLTIHLEMPEFSLGLEHLGEKVDAAVVEHLRQLGATEADHPLQPMLAQFLNNQSVRLSELGRREEALEMAQKAVVIRQQLAATRPDAFLPDLALSLNTLANRLSELGRREEALEMAHEAVTALSPFFLKLPRAYGQWMRVMLGNYIRLAENAGVEPDVELLFPILTIFQQIFPQPDSSEESR